MQSYMQYEYIVMPLRITELKRGFIKITHMVKRAWSMAVLMKKAVTRK